MRQTERQWQQVVTDAARWLGWTIYHPFDSRRSTAGYPDLTLLKGSRLIFAELKTDVGRLRPEQVEWLSRLRQVPGIEVHVWRPQDWHEVEATLKGGE